jgi:hypothetical protein
VILSPGRRGRAWLTQLTVHKIINVRASSLRPVDDFQTGQTPEYGAG